MHYDEATATVQAVEVYRLPKSVIPSRYQIRLTPDLKNFTFAGEETVEIEIHEPVTEIVLNALELQIDNVAAARDGRTVTGKAEFEPESERARLRFPSPLAPGPWQLKIAFRGILNDKLHGFYRSQYTDSAGKTHLVATTQMESTDARRAFPCWDEPELKASFKITLVIDDGLTAISNAGIESERRVDDGKKEVNFRETIRMSTYLVAFIVGEFEATSPVYVDGAPIRVVHVPGKAPLTKFGQEIGAFSLKWFSDYYGIKYPGDKLDLVAIPDFASGAMENLGAITFRETALLVDQAASSRAELERVADVVSHENAHMWFGDLVTMRWWNGIWLNEAFATFMEMLAVDAWKPNWQRWVSFGVSRAAAMSTDGLRSTRPIEFAVHSPSEAAGMFDVLTYEKGASVLRMLERYLGGEEFRKGISLYLRKHEYANTETGDLWDALERSSGHPVRKMMDSWIFQPGFPIVTATPGADGKSLVLSQRRFLYAGLDQHNSQLWDVPVMVRAGGETYRVVLDQPETTLKLNAKLDWVLVNEGGHGFYRVRYAPPLLAAITRNLDKLEPIERFCLVNDTWAAVVAGLSPLSEFMKMAALFREETDLNVWRAMLAAFSYLEMVVDEPNRPALAAAIRRLAGPAFARLGWSAKPGESELQGQLRATLAATLGTIGEDKDIQVHARDLYGRYREDPSSVDPDLVPALISILAHCGGEAQWQAFKQSFKSAKTPQDEQRYLFSLADFRDPKLLRQTMEMTLNGEVRTQNAPYLMHDLLANTASRDEAWKFLQSNWDKMNHLYPENAIPRMSAGIIALIDHEPEVVKFFAIHPVKQGSRTIDQHLEKLKIAVAFRNRERANFAKELKN